MRHWLPYAAAAIAAAIVLPNLGGPGFWDPDELGAVTEIGRGEWSARIGFALLGLLAVALVFATGWRLAQGRAGALAAIALATCPMFILHARLATSDMPALTGAAAVVFGVSGLARRRSAWSFVDAAIAAAGLVACAASVSAWSIDLGTERAGFAWAGRVEALIYGAFPWILLALSFPAARRSRAATNLVAAAVAVWIGCSVVSAAAAVLVLPPLAVAAGIALSRQRGRAPAAAAGVLALCLLVGRDLMRFPGKLAAIGTGVPRELPIDSLTAALPMVLGIGFGIAAAIALLWPRRTAVVPIALAVFGLVFAHVWIPRVSVRHSQKHLFELWRDARGAGTDPVVLLRVPDRAAREYAGGEYRAVSRASQLADAFRSPGAFAITRGAQLCSVRAAIVGAEAEMFVLSGDWDTFALLSSSLPAGHFDRSPLAEAIARAPKDPPQPIAKLADGLEIVDVDMPRRVRRGSRFEVVMRYRVTARPRRAWKVFAHFDGPGIRFQGDHKPVHERCPSTQWMPGDIITDRFTVKAGNLAHPRGRYLVWVGFFVGSHGNWTNLEVVSGDRDGQNRAHVGSIQIW